MCTKYVSEHFMYLKNGEKAIVRFFRYALIDGIMCNFKLHVKRLFFSMMKKYFLLRKNVKNPQIRLFLYIYRFLSCVLIMMTGVPVNIILYTYLAGDIYLSQNERFLLDSFIVVCVLSDCSLSYFVQ